MKTKPVNVFPRMVEATLRGYLTPKLAADAQLDLRPVVTGLQAKGWNAAASAKLKIALDAALKPGKDGKAKLAMDADVADVQEVLNQVAEMAPEIADLVVAGPLDAPAANAPEGMPPGDPDAGATPDNDAVNDDPPGPENPDLDGDGDGDGDAMAAAMTFLDGKLSPEDLAQLQKILTPEVAVDKKLIPTKTAMDAAIKSAADGAAKRVREEMRATQAAERAVLPFVGPINVAMDSAEEVYKFALGKLNVDVKNVHPSAYPAILAAQPVPGSKKFSSAPPIAQDAAQSKSYGERFPQANRLKTA